MKISELIEQLKAFPQDLPVFLDGYESGIAEIAKVENTKILYNANSEWFQGPHEESVESDRDCVVIRRHSSL